MKIGHFGARLPVLQIFASRRRNRDIRVRRISTQVWIRFRVRGTLDVFPLLMFAYVIVALHQLITDVFSL